MDKFSVVTSVYRNDKSEFVRVALDSMLVEQTLKPSEIVLVQDGPVPVDLGNLLSEYEAKYPDVMHIIRLDKNGGLGNALKLGVENATYNIVARMDSDDICLPYRFEKQVSYMKEHPECDIVGGQMTEFIGEPTNALNHVTVMFRRDSILKVGNYKDWFWNEDYYLWVRMMMNKCVFANLSDVLVNVRSGEDQYARRGGMKYFKSEEGIQRLMLDNNVINRGGYFINVTKRLIVQLLLPNWLRGWVFRTFARK